MVKTNTYTHEDLLTPLAITVIIDNKVRDPEMREFVLQAGGLLELLGGGTNLPDEKIRQWFNTHEQALTERLRSKKRNTFILKVLNKFKKDDIAVEAIYDAMLHISISDKEYHYYESDLIKSAASLWGYTRPPFKVKRN